MFQRKPEEKKESKQRGRGIAVLPLFLSAACVVLTVFMALYVLWFYRGGYQEETAGETYGRYYMMITEDDKSAFWQSVYQGAVERALEENVYVDWLGKDHFRDYSVEQQMEIAIASGVDGIIVTASETEEMTELINKASEEGIPVVTLYGDNTQSARCSFVGVGSYNLGREYGRQAIKIIREKLVGGEGPRRHRNGGRGGETGEHSAPHQSDSLSQCLRERAGPKYSLLRHTGDDRAGAEGYGNRVVPAVCG